MNIKKIVTHPGTAHGDDFLACCILAAKFGVSIERREPIQSDLDDLETLVLDVGGQYDHADLNFDHHHDLSIPCSAVLVLQWLGLHEKFQRTYHWYDNVDFRDRNGAQKLGEKYNLSAEQMAELGSPVHTALLAMFEKNSYLEPYRHAGAEDGGSGSMVNVFSGDPLYEIMRGIGQELIAYAENYSAAWDRLEKCECRIIETLNPAIRPEMIPVPYEIMINPSDDITATADFMRERKIAIMCSHDNRGAGWAILRSNDFPEINLASLASDPRIQFAHKGGFIAKTKVRITVSELLELLITVI